MTIDTKNDTLKDRDRVRRFNQYRQAFERGTFRGLDEPHNGGGALVEWDRDPGKTFSVPMAALERVAEYEDSDDFDVIDAPDLEGSTPG